MIVNSQVADLLLKKVLLDPASKDDSTPLVGHSPFGEVLQGDLPEGVVASGSPEEVGYLVGALPDLVDPSSPKDICLFGGRVVMNPSATPEVGPGDIVMLNSGGPNLTGLELTKDMKSMACGWFSEDTYMTGLFPLKSLRAGINLDLLRTI